MKFNCSLGKIASLCLIDFCRFKNLDVSMLHLMASGHYGCT